MDGSADRIERASMWFHDVCAHYDLTPRALRYYEFLEIISSSRIGRDRLYHARELVRLELLLRARRFRLTLETARQLIELYDSEGPLKQEMRWKEALRAQHARIAEEIAHLNEIQDEMTAFLET